MNNNKIRHFFIFILFINLLILAGCFSGPAVIQRYSIGDKKNDKIQQKNVFLYRIIVEGDNYDRMIEKIILDKVSVYFSNINANVTVSDSVFKNDIDSQMLDIEKKDDNSRYDYIFFLIIRTKNLGYSIRTLSDETNIYLNSTLLDSNGEVLTTSLFNKTALYPISNIKKFHFDLMRVLNPIRSYIQSDAKIIGENKEKKPNDLDSL